MSSFGQFIIQLVPDIDQPVVDYVTAVVEDDLSVESASLIHPFLSQYAPFSTLEQIEEAISLYLESAVSSSCSASESCSESESDSDGEFLSSNPAALELTTKSEFFEEEKARIREKKNKKPPQALNSVCSTLGGASLIVSYPPNLGCKSSSDGSICLDSFSITFGARELLVDTSISVTRNNIYSLVGMNGCGKSTFFNALASGKFKLHPELKVYLVRQDASVEDLPVIEAVLKTHINPAIGAALSQFLGLQLQKVDPQNEKYVELECFLLDNDALPLIDEAKAILKGLGFDKTIHSPFDVPILYLPLWWL
ncbi:hypothetical protein GEMRC1_005656 [Eukaryota sp. GEM-RC1]